MTNDIKALIDYYEREKGLSREKILLALESAFLSAYRKMVPGSGSINYLRAEINVDKGKVRIFADLEVVPDEEYSDKFNQIPLSLAVKLDQNAVLHDLLPTNITPKGFGRIAVQTARQTMLQKLLDAEKEMLYDEFKDRAGDLVTGTIRRFEKGDIFVDLGKFEGVMTSRERVPNEDYSVGDRMRFYVVEVRTEARGPEVILSRSHPNLVRRLFESEVVEIGDQTVEIHGIAREAGYRTKVAVISHDDKVDPVGACVGMRGARVKNIVRELNNEKVDILEWTEDPVVFVREALSPVEPREITVDEEAKKIFVIVQDDKDLSKAIGRRGQNARLTSRLMNWDVQVRVFDVQEEEKRQNQAAAEEVMRQCQAAAKTLSEQLEIPEETAMGLVTMGGTDLTALTGFEASDIAESMGIPAEEAAQILDKARDLISQ
ncbi:MULTISPECIES: transcription termination factor NusA [Akkermansia]|mgnify:FL=1|jgi:N utilization substance protein A|uniref:Transcription termination/antitermination protein NusA n=1 Tax=Akkermansia muciniphila TaxID=239935 RepID=A0A2N8HAQ7_9BACT|nr:MULTISPECIES: transcription termination factor NusA [Akkermansia]PNC05209.1 transcription termination/antitermination protein NusA [Akkermansia muciniphila]PNC16944.1 transcription termination/antitermination protein NusA [Akkermansia muciniphila]